MLTPSIYTDAWECFVSIWFLPACSHVSKVQLFQSWNHINIWGGGETVERLKGRMYSVCGDYPYYKVRRNQSQPTQSELWKHAGQHSIYKEMVRYCIIFTKFHISSFLNLLLGKRKTEEGTRIRHWEQLWVQQDRGLQHVFPMDSIDHFDLQ